jgi:hypothetical protein
MVLCGKRMRWTAALFSVWVAGCVDSHVQTDPVPLTRFCDEFFEALCAPLEACGCGELAIAACLEDQRDYCAGFPSPALVSSIEAGRLRYDGAVAAELFRVMSERGCEGFFTAIDWRVEAGQACAIVGFELITECALGSCTSGVCQTVVGAGQTCDVIHICADLDAELRADLGAQDLSMRCADGTCVPKVELGGACAADADCAVGACEGTCAVKADGAACALSRECASGHCDGVCLPGDAPDGSACEAATACASGVCSRGACAPAGCGTF